eukprot:gene21224-14126_t
MVMVQSSVAIFLLVFALASTDSISGGGCNISGGWHVGGHGHWAEVFQTSANGSFSATAFGVPHGGWHTAHGTYADSSGAIAIAYDSGRGTDQGDPPPPPPPDPRIEDVYVVFSNHLDV